MAEELNFTRAAKRMHTTQPALSKQILKLERVLGVALFRRNKQTVALTQEGRELHLHACKVLKTAHAAVGAVRAVRQTQRGSLSIGAVSSAVYAVLPAALAEFRKQYPDIEISLREQTAAQLLVSLRHGQIDIAFMRERPDEPELTSAVLACERLVAVFKAGDPLCLQGSVTVKELASRPLVTVSRQDNPVYSERVASIFAAGAVEAKVAGYASDMHAAQCMVLAGLGVSVVPASLAAMNIAGLSFRPITDSVASMDSTLVWHDDSGCPCLMPFIEIVRRVSSGGSARSKLEMSNGSRIDMFAI